MRVSAILALLLSVSVGQDKPAAPFGDIVSCVRVGACRNMTAGTVNWFDVVRIPVLTFADSGWTYALQFQSGRPGDECLVVFLTPPGETRAAERVSIDMNGHLATGELGPQPGELVPSRDSYEVWASSHKVFAEAAWHPSVRIVGEEFRPFWQKLADQTLAAAGRAIGSGQTSDDIRGIHEAVLKAIFTSTRSPDPVLSGIPTSFVVYAEYRKLYAPNDRVWQVLGPVPAALRRQVTGIAAAEAPPSTELHTIEQFPAGAHVLPQSEGLALIRGGPRDMSGYPALQQKYGAGNVLSLSKPVITDDGLDAFVHYSHGCGSACGTLGYVWLHRMSRGQPWTARVAVTAGS